MDASEQSQTSNDAGGPGCSQPIPDLSSLREGHSAPDQSNNEVGDSRDGCKLNANAIVPLELAEPIVTEPDVNVDLPKFVEEVIRGVFKRLLEDLSTEDSEQDATVAKTQTEPKTIAEVRACNLEMYKNRFGHVDETYTLEVLFAGPNLSHDVRREELRRRSDNKRQQRAAGSKLPPDNISFPKGSAAQRIRVQSAAVLICLAACVEENWSEDEPRTFVYPFRVLIHYQDKMRKAMNVLAKRWDEDSKSPGPETLSRPELTTTVSMPTTLIDGSKAAETGILIDEEPVLDTHPSILNRPEAYHEMRCYVDYVDRNVLPLNLKYQNLPYKDKVSFDDLWLLYTAGETLFCPVQEKATSNQAGAVGRADVTAGNRQFRMSQQLWRLYGVIEPFDRSEFVTSTSASKDKREELEDEDDDSDFDYEDTFHLSCYYIDYDGLAYRPVQKTFSIRRFDGEKAITSLICYPLRYAENIEELRDTLRARGRLFQNYIQTQHMSYSNWTLGHNPVGSGLITRKGAAVMTEFIDSPVIVDFEEAFNENPRWKPDFTRPMGYSGNWTANEDGLPIQLWSDYTREVLVSESYDNVQEDDDVTASQHRAALANDEFLIASKRYRFDERSDGHMHLRDEDLELLPSRVFAYALRERKHVALDVTRLRPIVSQEGVFKSLKIKKNKKEMIRSLVNAHFAKKELEGRMDSEHAGSVTQDIIQAKGKGLVILLHGVPGVGKTATAEAVALEKNKPLFSVTCGDIGFDMLTVDMNLRRIFRLANRWNCILLIDEADVFLTERSRYDLARNALVSVFLRAVEYYDGVLFLTTNRVGQLDEAFNSRLHLTLYYAPLSQGQTQQIFKTNIEKLKQIDKQRREVEQMPELHVDEESILRFADQQFIAGSNQMDASGSLGTGIWNGRQIRNAFQIASSLAYQEMSLDSSQIVTLNEEHFLKVERIVSEFKTYLKRTRGYNESDLAYLNKLRADGEGDTYNMDTQSAHSLNATSFVYQQQRQQRQQRHNMDAYTNNMNQMSQPQLPLHAATRLSNSPTPSVSYRAFPPTSTNIPRHQFSRSEYSTPERQLGGSQGLVPSVEDDYD